eukprot:364197-Chlamydomonas_euryale.AAC.44
MGVCLSTLYHTAQKGLGFGLRVQPTPTPGFPGVCRHQCRKVIRRVPVHARFAEQQWDDADVSPGCRPQVPHLHVVDASVCQDKQHVVLQVRHRLRCLRHSGA